MHGLLLFGVLSTIGACSNTAAAGAIPLPEWPNSITEQHSLLERGTQAYLSSDHTELVFVLKAADGSTTLKRFSLHNRIKAEVRANISKVPEGYRYAYTISNSDQSEDPIDVISMAIPKESGPLRVAFSKAAGFPNWPGAVGYGPVLRARQAELRQPFLGRFLSWVADGPYPVTDSDLGPGHSLGGFSIVGAMRPGFTTMYMLGQFPYIPDEDAGHPGVDLGFMGDRRWTDAHCLVIGPMFRNSAAFDEVAGNLRDGLQRAEQCGKGTDYVRELERIIGMARSFGELIYELDQLPRPREGSFEAEVAAAIRLTAEGRDRKTKPGDIRK
jgi:hypothetical protein